MNVLKPHRNSLIAIAVLALASQVLSFQVLWSQANLFENLTDKTVSTDSLLILLAMFCIYRLVSALLYVFSSTASEWLIIRSFQNGWKQFAPKFIAKNNLDKAETFYQSLAGLIPELHDNRLQLTKNYVGSAVILAIFAGKIYLDKLWWGILILPAIMIPTHLSVRVLEGAYRDAIKQITDDRPRLMKWISAYFTSSRERQLNWANFPQASQWYDSIGGRFAAGLHQHFKVSTLRSFVRFIMIDCSYLGIIAYFLYLAILGRFSFGDVFIWIGIVDMLVAANGMLIDNRQAEVRFQTIYKTVNDNLGWIVANDHRRNIAKENASCKAETRFQLLDGSVVGIKTEAGIQKIAGGNGTGKTTLVDAITGFHHDFQGWCPKQIELLRNYFGTDIRLIDRSPIIFDGFKTLKEQAFGPGAVLTSQNDLAGAMAAKLDILPLSLKNAWLQKFTELEGKWSKRSDRGLSSGEKVILSFARMLSSWNPAVKAIVCDEVDSFLDAETRKLFDATIEELGKTVTIFYISHERAAANTESAIEYFYTRVFLLGIAADDQQGVSFPIQIVARPQGTGKVEAIGSIARQVSDIFLLSKKALTLVNTRYGIINELDYTIECTAPYNLRDARSAGLALCMGLVNIFLVTRGSAPLDGVAATGQIQLDGFVASVDGLREKLLAARLNDEIRHIFTADDITSIAELEDAMMKIDKESGSESPQLEYARP